MDLTYSPGELDYKDIKKDDSKMKRDHDSVDDFEHLDPDSPAEVKQNNIQSFNTNEIINGSQIQPDKLTSSNDLLSHPYPTHGDSHFSVGQNDASSEQFDPLGALPNPESKVDGSSAIIDDFAFNVAQTDLLGSETSHSVNNTKTEIKESSDSTKTLNFIEAEAINNKNDFDNSEKTSEPFPSVIAGENKESSEPLVDDFFSGKPSMKEADALSQYDIKVGKKESDPLTDGNLVEQKHIPSKIDNDNFDSFAPELTKPPSHVDTSEMKIPEVDLSSLKEFESQKDNESYHEHDNKNTEEESKDGPFIEYSLDKPYIAICPSKPETEEIPVIASNKKKASVSDLDDIIGPEDVFKRIGLDAWFTPDRLHPKVEALVYWRDPKKSGVVFGGVMAILLSLCYMSLISVVAYSSLLGLLATISFRIYKNILQAVQKTSEGHPFKEFLDIELSLPQEKVREIVDTAVVHVNAGILELRRLFLVEDLIDSIKFGVCLWCLTYVGAIFNGMTLVILAFVALFTVPKIYENNKASIDQYIEMGRSKVAEITTKVKAAVPIGKKEEKDKEQ